ncbi:ATP phosphoribosyltransferase regulatory subunit [Megamonas hypermegale]|jgi:ATP phosphoribosyltransferase regulatory subunit|uniref:ATP phosphoribosyltransferase regulatory subunit n=1 Tax=Megamonas hypermegale TaxID=158847 RepID=UPI001957F1A9|nr:ATP phosphoribosyltransferase regulatory subunit [Megamonas hypermegale]MBM6832367.1 ATP phosphoribosyltransferase regulatory subunit [Megamonas hypermegale]
MLLEIPYGTRDFLPKDAKIKRNIELKLAKTFNLWGYDEIVTPSIEYVDTLTINNRNGIENQLFKFFDKNNRTLALRHEMTTPIARVAASRMYDDVLPFKLSYISSVYRYEQAQEGRQCEFYQAGVELMGVADASADAEIIALAVDSLRNVGLTNFEICLGQVEFINGIMQQMGLSKEKQNEIRLALEQRNLVDLNNAVEKTNLPEKAKKALKSIPLLQGKEDILEFANNLALNEQSRKALDNLHDIYELLKIYGVADNVTFDLGVNRDFSYYTGMVFEIYAPGIGYPICGGGRYDNMLSDFGTECPATGFALGIERLMLALDKQNQTQNICNKKDVYIAFSQGKYAEAINEAMKLRENGKVVDLAFKAQTREDAIKYQLDKNINELIYIE